jgi:uncharacterized Ntn-hydrolase superfamily protein
MLQAVFSRAAAKSLSRGRQPTDMFAICRIQAAQRQHKSVAATRLLSLLLAAFRGLAPTAKRCRRFAAGAPLTLIVCASAPAQTDSTSFTQPELHTFSIAAFDPATGDLGISVASKFLGVGSVVPYVKAGVGAVATQANANPTYGPEGLKLLESGKSAQETLEALKTADMRIGGRQAGIVDAKGNVAAYSGPDCGTWAGHFTGDHYTAQGNLLAGEEVVKKMGAAFEEARKADGTELADWLLAALKAGDDVGGDKRGKQSAAVLVARARAGYNGNDRYIDLRVEDDPEPIPELMRILEVHKQFFAGAHRRRPRRVVEEPTAEKQSAEKSATEKAATEKAKDDR